jgi:hypothetical protein
MKNQWNEKIKNKRNKRNNKMKKQRNRNKNGGIQKTKE